MKKKMLIDSQDQSEIRIAILEENKLIDFESENVDNNRTKGNIYLAKIVRVEPSLQAALRTRMNLKMKIMMRIGTQAQIFQAKTKKDF